MLRSIDDITPEELERLRVLARRHRPAGEANNLVLGVGLLTALVFVIAAYLFLPQDGVISLGGLATFLGGFAVAALLFWGLFYWAFERPKDMARKQLEHFRQELKAREAQSHVGTEE